MLLIQVPGIQNQLAVEELRKRNIRTPKELLQQYRQSFGVVDPALGIPTPGTFWAQMLSVFLSIKDNNDPISRADAVLDWALKMECLSLRMF